ncbi:hypothetical protein [Fibrobacter sp. UWB11]|uniref:hypothetical protein n=1 Tax=Fibrobacter sp. UWB11 TaxID=1896202 RepID=UPI000928AE35|nr:hypothetical protein [Fibrobacter sp. UWB11]SIO15731.1 hypothetical protein SAMN05720758_1706 [Fibrobacter sp. UWB11]
MSEEIQNEAPVQEPTVSADNNVKAEATAEVKQTIIEPNDDKEIVNPLTGEVIRPAKPKEESSNSPYKQFKPETFVNPMTGEEEHTTLGGPQVIIKKDRGLAYYVGFALLVVLSFAFFFLPGITITFAASRLVDLNTSAAWVFSTILSFGVWLIFKLKIKGFEKSFHSYLVLCVICLVSLFAIQFITDYNIISEVVALLIGAKA